LHRGDDDAAGLDAGLGIDEDDQIHRGKAFGQFGQELMAPDHLGAADGGLLRQRPGRCLADPVIAAQRVAVADDEAFLLTAGR